MSKKKYSNINQSSNIELKKISSINKHKDWVRTVKIFPSGNIISVSDDRSINIFDGFNYKIIQNIPDAHEDYIINLSIKDENNFATCSKDCCINIWTKKDKKKYIKYKTIIKAHNLIINNLIYLLNNKIISSSEDNTMKIWELSNNEYHLLTSIKIKANYNNKNKSLASLLLLKNKNILVSAGENGTFFWKINKKEMSIIKFICHLINAICTSFNGLKRIDEDRIIMGNKEELNIISIKNKKIIKYINIPFQCNGITIIKEKGIFLLGGWSNDIRIYRNDNYEYLSTIKNAHGNNIVGFCQLKNGLFLSFSGDTTMKIWSIIKSN